MNTQTFVPISSPANPFAWFFVILLAIAIHLVFLVNYQSPLLLEGAKAEGEKGIEIGLKKILPPTAVPKPSAINKPTVITKTTKKVKKVTTTAKPLIKKKPQPITKPKPIVISEPIEETQLGDTFKTENQDVKDNLTADKTTKENLVKANNNGEKMELSTSSAPSVFGGGNPEIQVAYETQLLVWLERFKRYPMNARRRGHEDIIEVEFTIDKNGNVLSQNILQSSQYKSLNRAVENMIKRASPVPPVPEAIQMNKDSFTFIVPVTFALQ